MTNKVIVSYSATQVGRRQVKANINVQAAMTGITRGNNGVSIDRLKLLGFVKEYFQHAFGSTEGFIDLVINVVTEDKYTEGLVLKFGFMPEHILEPVVYMQAPVTQAAAAEVQKAADGRKAPPSDDVPDSELTPKQRKFRQDMAQKAEDAAFASYSRKR